MVPPCIYSYIAAATFHVRPTSRRYANTVMGVPNAPYSHKDFGTTLESDFHLLTVLLPLTKRSSLKGQTNYSSFSLRSFIFNLYALYSNYTIIICQHIFRFFLTPI